MTQFDAVAYWRDRLRRFPGLQGTGTSFLPAAWQRWLYQAKRRAYGAVLAAHGVSLQGKHVINLGCGTGYFEDEWERAGAARADGIDVAPEAIERLILAFPRRRYVCADLARDPAVIRTLGEADLVTAIDVLYHIVEDELVEATVASLVSALRSGGHLLFTDGAREASPAPHVRFRGARFWRELLDRLGFEWIDRRPVAVLANRPSRVSRLAPGLAGAIAYHADAALLRVVPGLANNWVMLARKP